MHGAENMMPVGIMIAYFIIIIASLAGMWKVYEKAGHPGWKAIIPVYNLIILMRIIRKPAWWVLLMIIPYIGIIWSVWSTNLLSKSFGKGIGTTLGLFFLPFIFYPMLGFGDDKYTKPKEGKGSIADSLHKGIDEVEVAFEKAKDTATDLADKTEGFVSDVADDAKKFVENTKDDFKKNFDEDKK